MFENILTFLDKFLPNQFVESTDVPLLYRGRIFVAINLLFLVILLSVGFFSLYFNLSVILFIGALVMFSSVLSILYFIKKQTHNIEKKFLIAASLQIILISTVIYATSFMGQGVRFFGLLRLVPIFIMMAFYFESRFSIIFATIHFLIFLGIIFIKNDPFFDPFHTVPNFSAIFLVLLSMVIIFSYLLALLFVQLNERLQKEVLKQKDLLTESAKFQSLGQMASNLAHDINNPLFTIQGKLHHIRDLLSQDKLDLKKCDQIVESAEVTILRLSQIVKAISSFAREGRTDQMISISVAEIIENNLVLIMDKITNSGIKLEVQIEPNTNIICYPSFMAQIILNLLNNAIDAIERSPNKLIEIRTFREKKWINIAISDSGDGVPSEIEQRIFEPFFTTKPFRKGTGLGLSISKGLVEVHEGELSYKRIDNKSQFTIRLPSYD